MGCPEGAVAPEKHNQRGRQGAHPGGRPADARPRRRVGGQGGRPATGSRARTPLRGARAAAGARGRAGGACGAALKVQASRRDSRKKKTIEK